MKWYYFFGVILLASCSKPEADVIDDFFHVQVHDAEIPVKLKGNFSNKKVLVYINGGPALTAIDIAESDLLGWSQTFEMDYVMLYFDPRGTGNAQGTINDSLFTLKHHINEFDHILQVTKSKLPDAEFYLMGHSFGGLIAMEYLAGKPSVNVKGWICVDGLMNANRDSIWEYKRIWLTDIANEKRQNGSDEYWQECYNWINNLEALENRSDRDKWEEYVFAEEKGLMINTAPELSVSGALRTLFCSHYNPFPTYMSNNWLTPFLALSNETKGNSYYGRLSKIEIPTLFIWGKYDDILPPQMAQQGMKHLKANSKQLVILENSGHEPFISEPEHFRKLVDDFIR